MTEQSIRAEEKIAASEVLAYNFQDAARVLGISYSSLHREMQRGKIRPLQTFKLISRDELIRYVRAESAPAPSIPTERRRARRIVKPQHATV